MKKGSLELKWGLIFIGMGLIWMVLERLFGLHDINIHLHAQYTNLIAIPAILIYILAVRDINRKKYAGKMTYRQAFISTLYITALVTIASPLTQLITSYIITPNYFENAIRFTVAQRMMTLSDAEAYFNINNYIIQSTLFAPIMGIITGSLVSLGYLRNK